MVLFALSALSGAALFLSDYPVHAWPLQAVALVPFLYALARRAWPVGRTALAGVVLGLSYTVPLLVLLEFPLAMGAGLALVLTALWAVSALGLRVVLRWPPVTGALAAGAVVALVEWANFTLVPVWGTAQCFARVWSAAPFAVQIVSLTGMTGLVFVLVAAQALVAALLIHPPARVRAGVALALVVALPLGWSAWRWRAPTEGIVRVAAMGWVEEDLEARGIRGPFERLRAVYQPYLEEAVRAGASLVVSPEVGFRVRGDERARLFAALGELARRHGVRLAVGVFDLDRDENHLAFVGPDGTVEAVYAKTHLIPFLERYRAGDGRLVEIASAGARLGGMICQDDNFTDLARGYARRRVQIVAVPTFDWAQVKAYHFENSRFRAIENGYGIVRAAANGVSAIVSPRGELLARRDHFTDGPGVIVADLRVGRGGTPYGAAGEWFAFACAALLGGAGAREWRRRARAPGRRL